ncbi:MAG TPA: hypothetical protein VMS56_11420 [Thermoanaerobaculia bacterium]|nr:hypothetical protein [Thermoanaerobaculia bacterium]
MRTIALLVISVALARPASAADECAQLAALRALYEVRQLMLHPLVSSWDVSARIEQHLERLREPLPGGGYRWVRFVRPAGAGPVVKREHLVREERRAGDPEIFEAEAAVPYSVRVVIPRKRSLLRGNKEAWIGTVSIRYWSEGGVETIEREIDQWLRPDNSRTIDLGVIADRAVVSVETATRAASLGEALVEIHFHQAVSRDDPENPNYEGVLALERLQASLDPVTLDLEIARMERWLFPGIEVTPFTTIGARIREAERLLRSEDEKERDEGAKALQEVVRALPQ